jgi:hypothetical protein
MTITQTNGTSKITCDTCGIAYRHDFAKSEWNAMQEAIQADGWQPRRVAGAWEHTCSHCARSKDGRLL